MSESNAAGFGKFVPGFDFLQSLAKGATATVPQMPGLGSWVAPTLSVEELDKRIEELKNVQFWLEQNSRALTATIQALEVQRMTLATLKGMNVSLNDLAQAFTPKASDKPAAKPADNAADAAAQAQPQAASKPSGKAKSKDAAKGGAAPGMVDPLQLWGALTQQFQQIAAGAMQEVARQSAAQREQAQAGAAAASAAPAAKPQATARPARKAAPRKPSPRERSKAG